MINDNDNDKFSKTNLKYLAKEFRNFVLKYSVSHDHITESILNDIIKRPIEYILHRRQSDYDTDSETDSDSEDEEIVDSEEIINNISQHLINDTLKHQVNNILQKQSISNNLKQLLINTLLKQSIINEILKDSTISNEESFINDILNKKPVNNNNVNTFVETPKCIKFKKTVLNPRSNDNKSFQYSITLYLYQKLIGNNCNKITKISLISITLIGIILIFHQLIKNMKILK